MKVVVSIEQRFHRTPDGTYWTQTMGAYQFWTRYLDVFDQVSVVARVRDVDAVPPDWVRADGEGVSFIPVPYYLGPWQYLRKSRQVRRVVQGVIRPEDAVILRLPSQVAICIDSDLKRTGHPYGVEVVGDPHDVFSPGAVRHPFRPFFRWWFSTTLREQCARSCAAAYVTQGALQHRYPCSTTSVGASGLDLPDQAFTTTYSSIQLEGTAFAQNARKTKNRDARFNIIFVGSLAQMYKAPEILFDAVARCLKKGMDLQLLVLGDGKHRYWLEGRSETLGIGGRVKFLGEVSAGDRVRSYLDQADLFVLPSRTEGLPRAMIEAMARGLPCIGTCVGGIPELLPVEDMVPPGDGKALARKICEVLKDAGRMERMSIRNLEKAREYREDVLRERRVAFYRYVRKKTEDWINIRKGVGDYPG